jgi:hypothetical protein
MLPSRPSFLSLALICCVASAPLACNPAQVSRKGEEARSDVPRAMDGGLNLPDARPPAEGAGSAGAGGGPGAGPPEPGEACASEVHQAERPQVDLLLLLDSSSSMENRVPGDDRTLGTLVTEALTSFVKDPASAGLGVGVRFFPGVIPDDRAATRKPCQSDMECGPNAVCRVERTCLYQGRAIGGACPGDTHEGNRCQTGEMCVDAARCSLSKAPCHPPGQVCPGGMPGNVCEPQPRLCLPPAGSWLCQPSVYQEPTAPIGQLPAAEASLLQAFQSVQYTFGTPTGPALRGALAHARAHQAANPTHRVALVLATDGAPGFCGERDAAAISALVAPEAKGAPPISTYVIGAFSSEGLETGIPFVESVAAAGGTGKPFVLNTDPDLARNFLDALKKIRDVSLPCEFVIPRPTGPIDFGRVNVRLQDAAGAAADIPYVSAADRCDPMRGGWYYDVDPGKAAPTRVLTCPATCDQLKTGRNAKVSLAFGCKTIVID